MKLARSQSHDRTRRQCLGISRYNELSISLAYSSLTFDVELDQTEAKGCIISLMRMNL